MFAENQIQLLRDSDVEPTDNVLKELLGEQLFAIYQNLVGMITNNFDIQHEWRYYNDGKSWLFKATHKKKTIFWLSVWKGYIKTSFFFTEKTKAGIFDLPISQKVKDDFDKTKTVGKLIPLLLHIENEEQLDDFREITGYKKKLK